MNNIFRNLLFPILLILGLDLILLPDSLIMGVSPANEHSSEAFSKRSNPSVKTINSALALSPRPGMLLMRLCRSWYSSFTNFRTVSSRPAISLLKYFRLRFMERIAVGTGLPCASSECSLFFKTIISFVYRLLRLNRCEHSIWFLVCPVHKLGLFITAYS